MGSSSKFPLVYILWRDHASLSGGKWNDISAVKSLSPLEIHTVGWVISEDKEKVTLVAQMDNELSNLGGDMCILKSCIVKRKKLL